MTSFFKGMGRVERLGQLQNRKEKSWVYKLKLHVTMFSRSHLCSYFAFPFDFVVVAMAAERGFGFAFDTASRALLEYNEFVMLPFPPSDNGIIASVLLLLLLVAVVVYRDGIFILLSLWREG